MTRPRAPGVELREATLADAAAIARIKVAGWKAAYRGMIPDDVLDAMMVDEHTERWAEILTQGSSTMLVAERAGMVVGWSGFGKSRCREVVKPTGEILGFYVDPACWRTGVGAALWEESRARLASQGYETGELWVLEANVEARSFYEAMGCRLISREPQLFDIDGHLVPEVKYGW